MRKAGIGAEDYLDFVVKYNSLSSTKDADGKTVSGQAKQDKVTAYIHSLKLTPAQKDALYLDKYKESKLKDTPWHGGSMGSEAVYAPARLRIQRQPWEIADAMERRDGQQEKPEAEKSQSGLRISAEANAEPRQRSGLRLRPASSAAPRQGSGLRIRAK